jgi:hypothetical protein
MKIVFLCGSLEPGKNGVGDYVNRLARQLNKRGITVSSIALNDKFIDNWVFENEDQDQRIYKKLRIGQNLSLNEQITIAQRWITNINPDWLSLQYVPYSFHKKGLPLFLHKKLKNLGQGRRWHIMFHELWVGMESHSSIKLRFYGFIQRMIIKNMLRALDPKVIHTHASLYQSQLRMNGWVVKLLPLFGNIKLLNGNQGKAISKNLKIAVFGCLHPRAKLDELIIWLRSQKLESYCFHFLGSNGKELNNWLPVLERNNIEYKLFGWLEEADISRELNKCNMGITSTPYSLVEKSGCVAAMLEHQLEVICIGEDWVPRGIKPVKINIPVRNLISTIKLRDLKKQEVQHSKNDLSETVSKFITDLGH